MFLLADNQTLLIETMQAKRCLRIDEPSLLPSKQSSAHGDTLPSSASPMGTTSDYYSESLNHRSESDPLSVVDLTSNASPLLDFGKKEREYISKVIQITCQRTTLLRKNKFTTGGAHSAAKQSHSLGKPSTRLIGSN